MKRLRRRRAETAKSIEEATEALIEAEESLEATRARWSAVHELSGKADDVAEAVHNEVITNHFGDLFLDLLREG